MGSTILLCYVASLYACEQRIRPQSRSKSSVFCDTRIDTGDSWRSKEFSFSSSTSEHVLSAYGSPYVCTPVVVCEQDVSDNMEQSADY